MYIEKVAPSPHSHRWGPSTATNTPFDKGYELIKSSSIEPPHETISLSTP